MNRVGKQIKRLLLSGSLGVCGIAFSFPCYITIVKDNCWTAYDVQVNIINASNDKSLTTIRIPKGVSWGRASLDCQPKQIVMLKATFSPAFWENDANKLYSAKRYWSFPDVIDKNAAAWNMNVCFSEQFSSVPLPPESSGHCVCDVASVPKVPLVSRSAIH